VSNFTGKATVATYDKDELPVMTNATYNGAGLKTSATFSTSSGTTPTNHYLYNQISSIPSIITDSTNAYIYNNSTAPFEQVNRTTGTITYLITDATGSVRAVMSKDGQIEPTTNYDAYGNTTGGLSSYTPCGFSGSYQDPTGLIYLINRYYDPVTGQFISVDPLVAQTGQPYSYTGGDPVNAIDPSGMCNAQGNGEAWDLSNPWSPNNPICCSVAKNPSSITSRILETNPVVSAIYDGHLAYESAQNPCSSNWTIAGYAGLSAIGAASTVGVALGGASALFGISLDAETAESTSDLLSNLVSKAQATVGEGSGAAYGTAVYSEFTAEINALGNSDLSTEVSYLNGEVISYATVGSVRFDVVEENIFEPQAAYDLKTGSATLTPARIAQIQVNLPSGYQDIPVIEIRP